MRTPKVVYIDTRTVAQSYGIVGIVRQARTHRELAASDTVRPLTHRAAAARDAVQIVARNGWLLVGEVEVESIRRT